MLTVELIPVPKGRCTRLIDRRASDKVGPIVVLAENNRRQVMLKGAYTKFGNCPSVGNLGE